MNSTNTIWPVEVADLFSEVEALITQAKTEEAIALIVQQPLTLEVADALFSLTKSWAERGWYEPMWQICDTIVPMMNDGHKLAMVLAHRAQLFGDFKKTQHYAQQALTLNAGDPYARQLLCQLLLWDTQFKQGLEYYEGRFDAPGEHDALDWREFPVPRWAGESLTGKHLYLWTEQGVGDIIQFASFLPCVMAQKPASVTFGTYAKLVPLLQRSFPEARIETELHAFDNAMAALLHRNPTAKKLVQEIGKVNNSCDKAFDFAVPIGDLMVHYLPQWIPAERQFAYLKANAVRMAELRQELNIEPGIRHIGISWHTANIQNGIVRSIPLALFAEILAQPRCRFYSLQHDINREFLDKFCIESGHSITQPGFDVKKDIDSLAALMMCMDEIITIDNSNVHLAGALGVPTTLLLPVGCNYRWPILENKRTLWYENVHVLRQSKPFDWSSVMQSLAYDLGMRSQ